jgi:hypothetical protein
MARDIRNLQKQPLAGFVLHGWFAKLDFHGIVWVAYDFGDLRLSSSANLSIQAFKEVEAASEQLPPPALIADAMIPKRLAGEGGEWLDRVAHKAISRVGVQSQQEWNEEVMCVPERFERLLPYPVVCRGVHEKHTQQHNMAGDAAGLRIVDFHRGFGPDLVSLNIEEIDIVCRHVGNGEEQDSVRALAVEPLRLVQRQEPDLGPNKPQDIPAHGQ